MTVATHKDLITLRSSSVNEAARLRFALFLALLIHFLLAFGVHFTLPNNSNSPIPISLDVTLAHRESLDAPENADFVGQNNQQGAGDAAQAERPTTELEHFRSTEGETTTPSMEVQPQLAKQQAEQQLVATTSKATFTTKISDNKDPEQELLDQPSEITPDPAPLEQLNLEQDRTNKLETRGEKDNTISAAIKASPDEAPYLEAWRNKILLVGNSHYEPISKKLGFGEPTVRAVIGKQGQLLSVSIQKSSGNKLIDETAKELIRLAAPYDPLPASILKNKDVLEIVRKMRFDPGQGVSSSSHK